MEEKTQILFVAQHFATSLASYWQDIEFEQVIRPAADILRLDMLGKWTMGYSLPGLIKLDYKEQLKIICQTIDVHNYISRFDYIVIQLSTLPQDFESGLFYCGIAPYIK